MKLFYKLVCLIGIFLLASCSVVEATEIVATSTLMPTETITPTSLPTTTHEPTLEFTITPTSEPSFAMERDKIRDVMEEYGRVDEKFLSNKYWERIALGIEKYGPAKRILSLEYHGDNYYFYDGAYSMTPEQFEIQMRYLLGNEYHFVTGPELLGFLEGWLELPTRSIILTTDSGEASYKSIPRISVLFADLEALYGVAPHMNSYIWTQGMAESESDKCKNDACWQFFRDALETGYFSFGTHTQTHSDFRTLSDEDTSWDIETSKQKIYAALKVRVFGLTWPLEECSPKEELLSSLGIKYAFGGSTRAYSQLYTYANDNASLCLPRLFPPNPNGVSGRPNNLTLSEMLEEALIDVPLK